MRSCRVLVAIGLTWIATFWMLLQPATSNDLHGTVICEADPISLPAKGDTLYRVKRGDGPDAHVVATSREPSQATVRREGIDARPASMVQPTPIALPQTSIVPNFAPLGSGPNTVNAASVSVSAQIINEPSVRYLNASRFATQDTILGVEAFPTASSDLGSLLQKSPSALSAEVQARTPIVHDPRIRSSRVGALAASGSHWVPARADLDTILSKFDSHQIESITIIPGPYAARYGPGFKFTDIELLKSPRFYDGYEQHGRSEFDYKANGKQWFGQQSVWSGGSDWGARFNYGHRTGEDYTSGNGQQIPSSYNSREMTLALGYDLTENQSLEFIYLRLDQTGVEFPGYVFDIDFLVTDGYEVTHTSRNGSWFEKLETSTWYNRTRFEGNAQNPAKRAFFPFLDSIGYTAYTDVDSMSAGYRQLVDWGNEQTDYTFTLGHDLRFVKQRLNEISSGTTLGFPIPFADRNSPIPDSYSLNPGVLFEYDERFLDRYRFLAGGRLDYASSDITASSSNLAEVGLGVIPATYAEIVGADKYDRQFGLYSLYGSLGKELNSNLTRTMSLGYAERAPTLTELYAAQPFMSLLQNGLNNVTGDPTLKKEKMLQLDLALNYTSDSARTGLRVFHSWGFDYITFENTRVVTVPPDGDVGQTSLRYVNTELATFTGFETYLELDPEGPITPFANIRYVDGRDRTRNGDFATSNGSAGNESEKIDGAIRGAFSNVVGASSEPLPSISPLDTRIGVRFKDTVEQRWSLDITARIVDDQNRIATSLLETSTPGFTVWDARATLIPGESNQFKIVMGIENFLDRQYREHLDFRTQSGLGIAQPGANFYVGASLTY